MMGPKFYEFCNAGRLHSAETSPGISLLQNLKLFDSHQRESCTSAAVHHESSSHRLEPVTMQKRRDPKNCGNSRRGPPAAGTDRLRSSSLLSTGYPVPLPHPVLDSVHYAVHRKMHEPHMTRRIAAFNLVSSSATHSSSHMVTKCLVRCAGVGLNKFADWVKRPRS